MSTERSPRFPAIPLEEAVKYAEKLFKSAGRTPVDTDVAMKAIGYTGISGASRTTMAALSGYGLLAKSGNKYRVSDVGLRVIRPVSEPDKMAATRLLALKPSLFAAINTSHHDCSEQVLASTLLHQGFTEDGAKRAAKTYKANVEFAQIGGSIFGGAEDPFSASGDAASQPAGHELPSSFDSEIGLQDRRSLPTAKMLAQYTIPLGSNQATLAFSGEALTADDFDALIDFVTFTKRQFERALQATETARKKQLFEEI